MMRKIIFGTGIVGKKVLEYLSHSDDIMFADLDLNKQGGEIQGVSIIMPENIMKDDQIILAGNKVEAMYAVCCHLGLENIYVYIQDENRIEAYEYYQTYKSNKKVIMNTPPEHVTIGVTSACKFKCSFCSYHSEDAKDVSKVYGMPYMLKFEDFKKMINMLKEGGVPRVHICGTGEPFLNPDILKMIDYAISQYGKTSFQTDFWKTVFDKNNYLDEIVKRADKIEFIATDICAGDPKMHNEIKQGGDYNELLDALGYLAHRCDIDIHPFLILTKMNYKNLTNILEDLYNRGVRNCHFNIGNLFSYDFNEFTSADNVYVSTDKEITEALKDAEDYGKEHGICVSIPKPADEQMQMCDVFWNKFQTWPVRGCLKERYIENMVPHACAAVVNGDLNSLGYIFDYSNITEAWNSKKLQEIRESLLVGKYPSEYCKRCYLYHLEDSYYKLKVKADRKENQE